MTNRLDRDFHLPGLLRFALPTIIMMLVVSLYTIVDGVLIARLVGENALAAANVAYPAISFTLAMGIMLGTGGSAVGGQRRAGVIRWCSQSDRASWAQGPGGESGW